MDKLPGRKLLLLSVGYGRGHHSAAAALAEHYAGNGWVTRTVDVCEAAQPQIFRLTQVFYSFCVRCAPWLWGVTYALTDTADWSRLIHSPVLRPVVQCLRHELEKTAPDLIICTYPLFAYMLDELQSKGEVHCPYVVVVTDAREISRPWIRSCSPLVFVPDAGSRDIVIERYALQDDKVIAAGFPVRRSFVPSRKRLSPTEGSVRVLYGAYRQYDGVVNDVDMMLRVLPRMELTVIAGGYVRKLQRRFKGYCETGRLRIVRETESMPELLPESHIYIGKAGAATMFECYASEVPMLVNFTLPGQEQGNLELLLEDGAGCHVESTAHLVDTLQHLLSNGAAGWHQLREQMAAVRRQNGASCIAAAIENKFKV